MEPNQSNASASNKTLEELKSSEVNPEEKIPLILHFMRNCLSQEKTPLFKEFWEARVLVIPLFKQNISSYLRAQLWKEFIELTGEAKKIRNIFDEHASFNIEQIELVLASTRDELQRYSEQLEKVSLPVLQSGLKDNRELITMQREIDLLSSFASRLNSLRKEVLDTGMRMKKKNELLKTLFLFLDQVNPKKKKLMQEVSSAYEQEVEKFISQNFINGAVAKVPFYRLKEEIKALQADGKRLSLLPEIFSQTRIGLSSCWDKIRDLEKERKKERLEKRHELEEVDKQVEEKLQTFLLFVESKPPILEFEKKLAEVLSWVRSLRVDKDIIRRYLRLFESHREALREEKIKIEKKEKAANKTLQYDLKNLLTKDFSKEEVEKLLHEIEEKKSSFSLGEKEYIEYQIALAKEKLKDFEEKAKLENEPEIYISSRKKKAKGIKVRIDSLRKTLSGSGFDFERALLLNEMIDMEKKRLDEILQEITELEERLS